MPRFIGHALDQMERRGITKKDVYFCLNDHDVRLIPKKGYEVYFVTHPSGKRLKVVLNAKANMVVTAVWED